MRHLIVGSIFLLLGPSAPAQDLGDARPRPSAPALTVEVEAAGRDRGETPVTVDVGPAVLDPGPYRLDNGTEPPIPAVVFRELDRLKLGFILPPAPAGAAVRYALRRDEAPADRSRGVALVAEGRRVAVELDGQPWTRYVPDDGPKPYFDRLIGPTGLTLTRGWPMREVAGEPHDHPHHRSLWFAHLDVNKANTWDENPGHGQIRENSPPAILGGGPVGVLVTRDDWLDRSGAQVCADERVVRFYATRAARIFDFEVTLRASVGPLTIGDNKDGVFAVRLAAPMAVTARQGGRIVTARGLRDQAAWGQAAEWVDYTGPVGGQTMGVAILNHPSSFRYPTTWHVRDYGLFAANPFGWHDFGQAKSGAHALAAGESIRLAYRVVLHRGATEDAGIEALFQTYATPPPVKIL